MNEITPPPNELKAKVSMLTDESPTLLGSINKFFEDNNDSTSKRIQIKNGIHATHKNLMKVILRDPLVARSLLSNDTILTQNFWERKINKVNHSKKDEDVMRLLMVLDATKWELGELSDHVRRIGKI